MARCAGAENSRLLPDGNHVHLILTLAERNECGGPLAKRTAATPGPSTQGVHGTGHLFPGSLLRGGDGRATFAGGVALHRARSSGRGLVRHAGDWPWSSARAHLAGEDDELATVAPLRALIPDFPRPSRRTGRSRDDGADGASADDRTTAGGAGMDRGARAAARPPPRTRQTRTKAASGPCARAAAAAAVTPPLDAIERYCGRYLI